MEERVIVLGASLPGMLVADYCARQGKSVTLVAGSRYRPSRAEIGLGPQYLWATRDVSEYLRDVHSVSLPQRNVEVHWSHWGDGPSSVYPTQAMVEQYFAKMQTRDYPCRGVKSFMVVTAGLAGLRALLETSLSEKKVSVLHTDCTDVDSDKRTVAFDDGHLKYDTLYNTIDRAAFENMCGQKITCPLSETYFYTSPTRLHSSKEKSDKTLRPWRFDYICDPQTPVFRASWSRERDRWVYESRHRFDRMPREFDGIHTIMAKIRGDVSLPERPHVRHAGRWAELDPELMVSDVISRLSEICA